MCIIHTTAAVEAENSIERSGDKRKYFHDGEFYH
jgi:hypothetical protein